MKNTLYLFLVLIITASCQSRMVSEQELNDYVSDKENGLYKERTIGNVDVSVFFRPTDLLVAQEVGKEKVSLAKIDSLRSNYGKYNYFILNISKNDKELLRELNAGFSAFSSTLQTLAFDMGNYVNLTTSTQDTIPVADFIYPRMYGASKSTSLMFVFGKEQLAKEAEWVQFNLKDLGVGTGNLHFRFDKARIEEVPQIDFSK